MRRTLLLGSLGLLAGLGAKGSRVASQPTDTNAIKGANAVSSRKIDIYNHVMPKAVADLMLELAPSVSGMIKRVTSIPMLHDIEARIRMMESWAGYQQVLTISNPPIEAIAGP